MMNLVAVLCLLQGYEVFCYPPRDGNPPMFDSPFMIDDGLGPFQLPVWVEGDVNVNIKSGGRKVKYDMDIVIDAGDPCCGENHAGGHDVGDGGSTNTTEPDVGDGGSTNTTEPDVGDGGSTNTTEPGGACDSEPCNNGSCTPTGTGEEFICDCIDGFDGNTCETNIDDCPEVNPCQHGNCTDEVNGYSCECHSHFQTEYCTNYNFSWNGVLYELELTKREWAIARVDCIFRGGKLATPLSIEELRKIVDPAIRVLGLVDNIWIGGMVNSDGDLLDSLGFPLNDTFASIGSSISDVCFGLVYYDGDSHFDLFSCDTEMHFLCEF